MMTAVQEPTRDRSAGVKDAIRDAARSLFATQGYEATGIRDIAAAAGVNPAIVIRHFGSKERLFVTSIDAPASWRALLDGPIEGLGRRAARAIVNSRRNGLQVWGVVVRSSDRPDIHEHLRESVVAMFATPLAGRLEGTDARLRAHLFAAQLVGLMSALVVYDDQFLTGSPADQVVDMYGSALQHTLTSTPAAADRERGVGES